MEFVKVDQTNFEGIRPLVEEMFSSIGKRELAGRAAVELESELGRPGFFFYTALDSTGNPSGYIVCNLSEDFAGDYMFLRQVYSKEPWIGSKMIKVMESLSLAIGVPRVKAICQNPRVANAAQREGYVTTGIQVEKYLTPASQIRISN